MSTFDLIDQREVQTAFYGRKSCFEYEKWGGNWSEPLQYQQLDRSAKDNNSRWRQKHGESCEEKSNNNSQWPHQQPPQGRVKVSQSNGLKTLRAEI